MEIGTGILLVVVTALAAGLVAGLVARASTKAVLTAAGRRGTAQRERHQFASNEEKVIAMQLRSPHTKSPQNEVLTPAPMVWDETVGESVTLLDWVKERYRADPKVWPKIVADFYGAAAADPDVAEYFAGVLARPDGIHELQKHFMRAMIIVCGQGITVGLVRSMQDRHAGVRNLSGQPITADIYDRVIGALVGTLRRFRVPADGIANLATTVAPLRAAIIAT